MIFIQEQKKEKFNRKHDDIFAHILYENEEEIKDLYSRFKYLVEPSLFYLFKP